MIVIVVLVLLSLAQGYPPSPILNLVGLEQPLLLRTTIKHLDQVVSSREFAITYSEQQPEIVQSIELEIDSELAANLTIEVELYLQSGDHPKKLLRESRNLTRYQVVRKQDEQGWGWGTVSYDPMDEIDALASSEQEEPQKEDEEYCTHLPQDFDIMFVVSHMGFGALSPQHRLQKVRTPEGARYLPPVDLSQLYIPTTRARPLSSNRTVTLHIFPMSYQKYLMLYSLGHLQEFQKALGPLAAYIQMKEELMDEFKEFFFMNSPWLVGAYYLLALAEFLLKMAFIKSEFMFWKNIDQNKGVSLKTLFFELGAKIIFILYLYEYKSSKIILFFDSLDLLITLWKISRTFCLKLTPGFPFLRLATSDVYKQREAIDSQSIWYMNYLLLPLMGCYLTYALYTKGARVTHWYRFALDTTVAFIGIFGFILMTPQLYINYKLKSVDHLNWRGLIYRFVTTIIDDLFAFMITMPPLRRLLYFRDDIIFVLYIYQRQIYKTDFSRKTIFTQQDAAVPIKQE